MQPVERCLCKPEEETATLVCEIGALFWKDRLKKKRGYYDVFFPSSVLMNFYVPHQDGRLAQDAKRAEQHYIVRK